MWEWISLAQHYRVPTRLLDWSENPLVALYFAVEVDEDSNGAQVDGRVWALNPLQLNQSSYADAPPLPAVCNPRRGPHRSRREADDRCVGQIP